MNGYRFCALKPRLRGGLALALMAAAIYAVSLLWVTGADATAEKKADAKPEAKAKKKFTGAELYAIHCNRCHAERYATERTDAQWKTIMLHMQTRAQLPGKDVKAILKYLQENN
jgi:mono/diheme cytochrome c family protein